MKQSLETNRVVTGSLFIIASIAVAFILNFAQPFLVPLVIALLIRILIDPIIDYQITRAALEVNEPAWENITVAKAHLKLELEHSYMGDVSIRLVSPSKKAIELYKGRGRGDGSLLLDLDITKKLFNHPIFGRWTLEVRDSARRDQGTLKSVWLQLTPKIYQCSKG